MAQCNLRGPVGTCARPTATASALAQTPAATATIDATQERARASSGAAARRRWRAAASGTGAVAAAFTGCVALGLRAGHLDHLSGVHGQVLQAWLAVSGSMLASKLDIKYSRC